MDFSQFNVVDMVVAAFLLIELLHGLRRGLSGELAGVISLTIAVFAGMRFYQPLGLYLQDRTRLGEQAAYFAAFIGALVGAFLLMLILRLILRNVMEFTFKGKIERVGGALAGLLRGVVVAATALFVLCLWPNARLHEAVADKSVAGWAVFTYLSPVYQTLSEKYPALRLPGQNGAGSPREDREKAAPPDQPEKAKTPDEGPLGPVE